MVTDIFITKELSSTQVNEGGWRVLEAKRTSCRSREAQKGTETPNPAGNSRWSWDPAKPKKAGNFGALGGDKKPGDRSQADPAEPRAGYHTQWSLINVY